MSVLVCAVSLLQCDEVNRSVYRNKRPSLRTLEYLESFIHFPLRHSLLQMSSGKLGVPTHSGKFKSDERCAFIYSTKDNCR